MSPENWISLAGVLSGVLVASLTLLYTDRARKRERQADREDKDRAAQQAKEEREAAAAESARKEMLTALIPLVSLLGDHPPGGGSSDKAIEDHIERLRSDSATRALEAIVLVGLIYPSPSAQMAAGYVSQTVANVILLEEQALKALTPQERGELLQAAAGVYRRGEERIRELAREIRGPLPWEIEPAEEESVS